MSLAITAIVATQGSSARSSAASAMVLLGADDASYPYLSRKVRHGPGSRNR